jgi:hypothetical protein
MFRSTAERRAVYVSFRVDCHRADGITTVPTAIEGVQRGFRLTTSRRRAFMDRDPTQLQSEINQLIKKQLDTLGATDAEHREY